MSEEEKKAVKWFDTERKLVEITNGDNNYFSIILNLIDKLQKENEQLKEDSISKDIIRNKIKELEEEQKKEIEETNMSLLSVPIRILKELL